MRYELVPCSYLNSDEIEKFMQEFDDAREECNALWKAKEIGVKRWMSSVQRGMETAEQHVAFMVDDYLVGIARITAEPHNEANGKIGYYIRPSWRGRGLAKHMILMIEDYCKKQGIRNLTAVVDMNNERSKKSLWSAGWKPTSREFDWRPDPLPKRGIEYAPSNSD